MDLVVYDDDEKRYVPWAVALTAVLLVALLTAALTFLLARTVSGSQDEQAVSGVGPPEPATAPSTPSPSPSPAVAGPAAGATSSSACVDALRRADAVLTEAQSVEVALSEHTAIMDELLAERITADQALDQTLPVLTDGASARRQLEAAARAYEQAREECAA